MISTNVPFVILTLMERLLHVRNAVSGFILPVPVLIKLQLVPYMMMYHISAYYAMTINCIPIAILTRKCLRKNKLLILQYQIMNILILQYQIINILIFKFLKVTQTYNLGRLDIDRADSSNLKKKQ